ncbi:MAG: phage tail tape measure protein [Candidatus Hodarchaeales archaeon]
MAWEVGAIVAKLNLQKDQWDAAIKKVKADQKSFSGFVLKNSQQIKTLGRNLTIAGGIMVGFGVGAIKAFANFDKAMTESLAIMGDVSDSMRRKMTDAAKEMSTQTVYSAKELAQAYFFLASAGMDAAQSIGALPTVAKFAQAGSFDLATATDLLTDAQTALGLSSKDVAENERNLIRVSDVLVGANTLANASVKQFAESLTNKAAAALINVNKSMEEGVAVLAAYADKGIKGQLAGQRLTMMLNGLFDASQRNKKAWDDFGVSLFDSNGEMRDIADIIGDLEIKFAGMTTEQKQATLATLGFNMRTKDSILTLMGSSEKIRQWTKDLKNMGGITNEVSEKQLRALSNQLKLAKNNLVNAAISIGETLAPAIINLTEEIKSVLGKTTEWIKEHPDFS